LAGAFSFGENQEIAFLRPIAAAGLIFLRRSRHCGGDAGPGGKSLQKRTTYLVWMLHLEFRFRLRCHTELEFRPGANERRDSAKNKAMNDALEATRFVSPFVVGSSSGVRTLITSRASDASMMIFRIKLDVSEFVRRATQPVQYVCSRQRRL
jgi:hypothetical protein